MMTSAYRILKEDIILSILYSQVNPKEKNLVCPSCFPRGQIAGISLSFNLHSYLQ